jgi:hypothetical protein
MLAQISQNNFALRDSALRNTQETKAKVVGIHILGRYPTSLQILKP